jgi:glycosyltransferase involved in cell wall biosynthesis
MNPLVLLSSLAMGGAERVTVSLLRQLHARGVCVQACTVTRRHDSPLADELAAASVPRHDLGASRLADPRALWRLRRLVETERIDVIHAHGQDASIIAAALRRWSGVKLVVTRHVLDEPTTTRRERLRADGALWALRGADAVVAVSAATADRLATLARRPRRDIAVIHNGIDIDTYAAPAAGRPRAELCAALGADSRDRLILMPAMLRDGKGHDAMIAAMHTIRAAAPRARLLLAGSGEREAELRRLAAPLGDAVRFLGTRTDMPELYAACDVCVLPSLSEAFPTALLEAAAAGRPAVATAVGGTPEIVVHERTGLLIGRADPAELAAAVLRLLADPGMAAAMGTAAAARAHALFGLDRQLTLTMELWNRTINAPRRRAA